MLNALGYQMIQNAISLVKVAYRVEKKGSFSLYGYLVRDRK